MPRKKYPLADLSIFSSSISDSLFDAMTIPPSRQVSFQEKYGYNVKNIITADKPQRVEDTHTRQTFLIRNDLIERLNRIADRQSKGFKMRFLNYVLEKGLDELEQSGDIRDFP